jgi:uncharacterized protein YbbK (DUF523 family)
MTIKTKADHTHALETAIEERLNSLQIVDLSGFVFKRGSPSCGVERVRVYTEQGMPSHSAGILNAGDRPGMTVDTYRIVWGS